MNLDEIMDCIYCDSPMYVSHRFDKITLLPRPVKWKCKKCGARYSMGKSWTQKQDQGSKSYIM